MATIADRPEPTPEDYKASYGFVAGLANAVPEINTLLQQALSEKWTPDRFVMSVTNTGWWKSNGAGARDWLVKTITDPATAAREQQAGAWEIRRIAEAAGMPFEPDMARFEYLWVRSQIEQVKPNALTGWVFNTMIEGTTNVKAVEQSGGRYGQVINEMFEMASNYGYRPTGSLTDEIIGYANRIMRGGGDTSTDAFKTRMINWAQAMYAPYAEDIRGGKTVKELAAPVVERVSALLEVHPDALDINDPIMKKALTEWKSENGTNRAYSLREIEDMTRKDTRWLKTDNAMEQATKLVSEIGQRFGMVGN